MNRGNRRHYLAVSVVVAALATTVLATRVYVKFSRVQIHAAASVPASAAGQVIVPLPLLPALEGEPMSLVLRLRNQTGEKQIVLVSVGDYQAGRVTLRPNGTTRADLLVPAELGGAPGSVMTLQGTHKAWSLQTLAVGNAYGFSSGAFSLVIAPVGTRRYDSWPIWLAVLAGAGLLVASYRLDRPIQHRGVRIAHRITATIFLAVFVSALVLPAVSVYTVLLSHKAFWLAVAVIYFPVLNVLFWWARTAIPAGLAVTRRLVAAHKYRVLAAAAVCVFLVSIAGFYDARTGFTSFTNFGAQFDPRALPSLRAVPHHVDPSPGYDGQFYAQLALDPLARDPAIERALDNFAFRARRILFAWTAYALGLGRPEWIVHTYAMQNILYWLVLAILLFRWLPPTSLANSFAWFACLFCDGLVSSVRLALLEGPSLILIALAIVAIECGRPWLATGLAGVAGLGRETNLLAGAALVDRPSRVQAILRLGTQAIVVVLPLALWQVYLQVSHPSVEFDLGSPGNLAAPFSGLLEEWHVTFDALRTGGWASFSRFDLMAVTSVTVQACFLVVAALRHWPLPWHRVGLAYAALMICLGTVVWAGTPGAYTRVLLPMVWAYNITLSRQRRWVFWPLAILGNLTVLNGLAALRVPYLWAYL